MPRATYGERAICACCGQDIEFHGGRFGWQDRGASRFCAYMPDPDPYNRGAWVKVARRRLHKPYRG
jgi:hypothetical protein